MHATCWSSCRVKLADGNELKHDALKVGAELTIYSRKFAIVACDPPTREFYAQELGTPQPPDQPMPLGKYDVDRRVGVLSVCMAAPAHEMVAGA